MEYFLFIALDENKWRLKKLMHINKSNPKLTKETKSPQIVRLFLNDGQIVSFESRLAM